MQNDIHSLPLVFIECFPIAPKSNISKLQTLAFFLGPAGSKPFKMDFGSELKA